jgi:hypothetical protein
MQDEQVRAAVEAAVRAAMEDAATFGFEPGKVAGVTGIIMATVREHASDEWSRGNSDGRFTESFYGMSGDF